MLSNLECPVGLSQKRNICVHFNEVNFGAIWTAQPKNRIVELRSEF